MTRVSVLVVAALLCCLLPAGVSAQGLLAGLWPGGEILPQAIRNLKFEVAYLNYTSPVSLRYEAEGPAGRYGDYVGGISYPVRGARLGASTTAAIGDRFGVGVGGTWLVPDNRAADHMIEGGPTRLFETTRTQWYTLDAYFFWPSSGPFRGLAGFRYDALAL